MKSNRALRALRLLLAGALLLTLGATAVAQQFRPPRGFRGPPASETVLPKATTRDPARVRMLLRAIHGTRRAQLDAASTGVAAILRAWIDSPDEPALIRRQAIKLLRLYPSAENFAFVRARLPAAPLNHARLYLTGLAAYARSRPAEVLEAVAAALADGDVGMRHAGLYLAERLAPSPRLRAVLEKRLRTEAEPSLRGGLERLAARR